MSLKIIQKNIKTIVTTGNKLNQLIHGTAVLVLEHALAHGDCTTARDLINAMPASMRRTMLKLWFETYSPIRFQMKDGAAVKVGMLKDAAKGFTPFNIDGGREVPFFTLAEQNPEGKVHDFNALVAMVTALSKSIVKKVEDGKVPEEDRASAHAMAEQLGKLTFARLVAGKAEDAPLNEAVIEPLRAVA